MTLVDFLQLHYNSQEHPNDNDDQEDEELPFRSAGTIAHIDPFSASAERIAIAFTQTYPTIRILPLSGWQPPPSCLCHFPPTPIRSGSTEWHMNG
ncbi:MAG: hypothetical protein IPG86_06945 [Chitinophagaceae bacterium]|nr:hypothetical protein [Chitinophagaceae bacterium]